MKTSLVGIPHNELTELLGALPEFRVKQILTWIDAGTDTFDAMSNLPLTLRTELDRQFCLRMTKVLRRLIDDDGTVKLQISVDNNSVIETVLLNDGADRKTACLSTQAGCACGCVFCKTGSIGFSRNLNSSEIVEQLLHLRDVDAAISNIVFMGMGEPLLNLDALRKSINVICRTMSPRRITVSTCGIIKGIDDLTENGPPVRLAVSLTTGREDLRRRLMPVCTANPLGELKKSLLLYQQKQKKRITLETVLLGGINTSADDIEALCAFACGLDVVVNAIPWNRADGLYFECAALREPSGAEVKRFVDGLNKHGVKTVLRLKKGRGIGGACGQLGLVRE